MMLTGAASRVQMAGENVTKHKGTPISESDTDSAYITEPTETDPDQD